MMVRKGLKLVEVPDVEYSSCRHGISMLGHSTAHLHVAWPTPRSSEHFRRHGFRGRVAGRICTVYQESQQKKT